MQAPDLKGREDAVQVVLDALHGVAHISLEPVSELYDVPLGKRGLELDSVQIVEALVLCEDSTGIRICALLDVAPLTLGAVIEHFSAA